MVNGELYQGDVRQIQGSAPGVPGNLKFATTPLSGRSDAMPVTVGGQNYDATGTKIGGAVPAGGVSGAVPSGKGSDIAVKPASGTKVPSATTNLEPNMIRLPSGEVVPVVTKEMTTSDPKTESGDPAKKKPKPTNAALEQYLKNRASTPKP